MSLKFMCLFCAGRYHGCQVPWCACHLALHLAAQPHWTLQKPGTIDNAEYGNAEDGKEHPTKSTLAVTADVALEASLDSE